MYACSAGAKGVEEAPKPLSAFLQPFVCCKADKHLTAINVGLRQALYCFDARWPSTGSNVFLDCKTFAGEFHCIHLLDIAAQYFLEIAAKYFLAGEFFTHIVAYCWRRFAVGGDWIY